MDQANKSNRYLYNPQLTYRAKKLRRKATQAETLMWKCVLRNKIMGCKFYRQRPVLNYIADFMCKELMLIIEVDGITHLYEETIKRDKVRQKRLEDAGFKFLRFEDSMVINNLALTQSVVEQEIKAIESEMGIK
ncbi:MAG: DUF559 domain-containing protein [Bacteroidales bacterium]|nr:DUF559 domain-containing protein [Bacteroidales bacterium]